jgi:hypothetical protein
MRFTVALAVLSLLACGDSSGPSEDVVGTYR